MKKIATYSCLGLVDRKRIAVFLKDFKKFADLKDEAAKFFR